jgi:hypothetical protein
MKIQRIVGTLLSLACLLGTAWAQEDWQTITAPNQVFQEGYIQVIGTSEEGQSRYRALRAAQVVAQRDLLETMQGLNLTGGTSVSDGMLQSDQINTTVQGFLRGAVKCGQRYDATRRYGEVCMRVNIRGKGGLYDIILPLMQDQGLMPERKPAFQPTAPQLVPEVMPAPSQTVDNVTPAAAEPQANSPQPAVAAPSLLTKPYDGLIVDARGFQFRPALVNRILTVQDQVVFEPSKILSNILVERGCGGFTNDDSKAKALLSSWGSNNPLMVRCMDVGNLTEAKISQDDAAAVYVNDQKSNLLAQARVVFILQ